MILAGDPNLAAKLNSVVDYLYEVQQFYGGSYIYTWPQYDRNTWAWLLEKPRRKDADAPWSVPFYNVSPFQIRSPYCPPQMHWYVIIVGFVYAYAVPGL